MPHEYKMTVYEFDELLGEIQSGIRIRTKGIQTDSVKKAIKDAIYKAFTEERGLGVYTAHNFMQQLYISVHSAEQYSIHWRLSYYADQLAAFFKIDDVRSQAEIQITCEYNTSPFKSEVVVEKRKTKLEVPIEEFKKHASEWFRTIIVETTQNTIENEFARTEHLLREHPYLEDGTPFLGLEQMYRDWYDHKDEEEEDDEW